MSAKKFPVALKAFCVNLMIACIVILPFMIMDRGYFAMTHDYSAEEIPYQMLMNQAVRSGNLLWNWGIDLGGNVLETFSFYNLGSPFTWLLWLLPLKLVVKAMPLVIILKYAFADFL